MMQNIVAFAIVGAGIIGWAALIYDAYRNRRNDMLDAEEAKLDEVCAE